MLDLVRTAPQNVTVLIWIGGGVVAARRVDGRVVVRRVR